MVTKSGQVLNPVLPLKGSPYDANYGDMMDCTSVLVVHDQSFSEKKRQEQMSIAYDVIREMANRDKTLRGTLAHHRALTVPLKY